ncbi:protein SAR DEFICIENT 1-like isoform X2 [Aristolochia californica]|uniref:protein SAR DEFICIENT 1-like isoform X2 n=1 Tax=Aristolochia californica TaxID=171875 RepID=UPI0035E307A3
MAAKRFLDEPGSDRDKREEKRMRTTPSFSTVVREAIMLKSFESLCRSALEPLLRKVMEEELERGINRVARTFYRSPSFKLQAVKSSNLQLIFTKKLSLPIFTSSKIEDEDNNRLQIQLIDTSDGGRNLVTLPSPVKIELVVLDGDFPRVDREDWTCEEFNNDIVKEREGKRPLLTGEVNLTVRDGTCSVGDIEFTDNSSWTRSRTFRIGARVAPGTSQGVRIKEAKTESFQVKDHRGELYRKHYPPSLNDYVWRLERIGKHGAFHKKLAAKGIHTVQQFLKASMVDTFNLRKILGAGMSDRMWEGTIKHAVTCDLGNKLYLYRQGHYKLLLTPICEVLGAMFDDQIYPVAALNAMQKTYVDRMVLDAYKQWEMLEEVDKVLGLGALSQGAVGESHLEIEHMNQQFGQGDAGIVELPSFPNSNLHLEYNEWNQNLMSTPPATIKEGGHVFMADSGSDDDSITNPHPRYLFFSGS